MSITGPLGNPSEIKNFGKVLCVGGSIMIAPLMLQVKAMKAAGNHVTTVLGCRSKEFMFMEEEARAISDKVYIASDDGSYGYKGLDFLKEVLAKEKFDRCVAMGPMVLMRDVSEMTKPFGIPTIVTLTPVHDRRYGNAASVESLSAAKCSSAALTDQNSMDTRQTLKS